MVTRSGIGVSQVADGHVEQTGKGYGLFPTRILAARLPPVDCGFLRVAGGIDTGADVTAGIEQMGDVEGHQFAGLPQLVLVAVRLDKRARDLEVGREPRGAFEIGR
ncbi:hypothetical protein WSS_A30059 [Rhodococcus opacus M213]|uniref:Uncharacterized protein n=2 Tax=Rhodococcus TaxID=1827 RepID=K8XD96_RHOOP|nr:MULTISPECIES: hypothetical protein [Rhodococcus]EKT78836.1 hypothetical protein WSS_A30059 [Rhodococcus opacus M213]QSE87189.1 hypothetical protein JWS13_00305 [Rhodococcus pseudokoreensis]